MISDHWKVSQSGKHYWVIYTGMGPRSTGTGRQGKPGGKNAPAMAPNGGRVPSKSKSKIQILKLEKVLYIRLL